MSDCLTPETIDRYRNGRFDNAAAMVAVETHLAGCAACREAVHRVAGTCIADPSIADPSIADPSGASVVGMFHVAGPACLDAEIIDRYVKGTADAADVE